MNLASLPPELVCVVASFVPNPLPLSRVSRLLHATLADEVHRRAHEARVAHAKFVDLECALPARLHDLEPDDHTRELVFSHDTEFLRYYIYRSVQHV